MIAAKYLIVLLGSLAWLSLPVAAQTPTPSPSPIPKSGAGKHVVVVPPEKAKPVRVPRFDKPPVIDGKLDDEVWKQAAVFKDFYQINPGDNIAPSRPTEAFIGYDSKFLYLAFHCYDEPDKVRGTVAKRDQIFGEDNVRVFLDTFNDQRKAYVLGWNPLGIQQDGIMTEGEGTDFSVDIVMESWLKSRFHSSRCATKPAKTGFGGSRFGATSIASMTRSIHGRLTRAIFPRN